MISSAPALLDALADCLESGDTLLEALAKVATAGGAVEDWARHVRPSVCADVAIARALRESNVVDDEELSILSAGGAGAALGPALRAVVLRRRRSVARRRALRWGLLGPFVFGAVTVVLAPLPEIVTGGSYVWPVLRGLFALAFLTLVIIVGVPALLRGPRARSRALAFSTRVPGFRHLAALYAEEELTAALAPFLGAGDPSAAAWTAVASLLAWSPLGEALLAASRTVRSPAKPLPMGGLEPLARHLSAATSLALVGGVASKRLPEQLARRGEEIAPRLTAHLRLVTRLGAYALVVLVSASSLVGMIARGLPGMPVFPGGATSPDQKELEDLLKELQK
jgi:hypothetical protein